MKRYFLLFAAAAAVLIMGVSCKKPGPENKTQNKPTTETTTSGKPDSDTEKTGTDKPGTENPGTETPGTDKPGTENPGTETPGTDKPGTEIPGADKPSSEQADEKAASAIVGTYSVLLAVDMDNENIIKDVKKDVGIALSSGSTKEIDITLADLTFEISKQNLDLGTIVLTGCTVTAKEDGSYAFESAKEQYITLPGDLGALGACTASIAGTVKDKKVSAKITITWVGMPIVVNFEGPLK